MCYMRWPHGVLYWVNTTLKSLAEFNGEEGNEAIHMLFLLEINRAAQTRLD